MDIKILAELPKKILMGAGIIVLVLMVFMFGAGRCSKGDPETIVQHDTVKIETPVQLGGTLSSTTVIEEEDEDPVKPIPALTKYKVTDWVCAWDKWSGVVKGIHWSERNEGILVYEVQHWNETDQEWVELEYYDTELVPGKCN